MIRRGRLLRITLFVAFLLFLNYQGFTKVLPDTTGGKEGWRYATLEDVDYWNNVGPGDIIIFQGSSSRETIDSRQWYKKGVCPELTGGCKIHVWRGKYRRILLDGQNGLEISGISQDEPIMVTNLAGQVRWGESRRNDQYRGLRTRNITHLEINGEYDPDRGTGDPSFQGLCGNLEEEGWVDGFGLMADQKYSSFIHDNPHGTGLDVKNFETVVVRGVAAVHGYFAGFSIKNDPGDLTQTSIDVQRCLSGWHVGEGYYIGYNGSTNGKNVSENLVTFENNVSLFTGAEGLQVDFMSQGSVVRNNFIYKTGCYYQDPFQGSHHQENGFQWSFTEGGVLVESNIFYTGNAGNIMVGPRYKDPGPDRRGSTEDIFLVNNLLGPSRMRVSYIFQGDKNGEIVYRLNKNVIDSITTPTTNDAYLDNSVEEGYFRVGNDRNSIFMEDNIYPSERSLYTVNRGSGRNIESTKGSVAERASPLIMHADFGFDPRHILSFRGVYTDGKYGSKVDQKGPISYLVGDMVYYAKNGITEYFVCIKSHNTPKPPMEFKNSWKQVFWNNKKEPNYTPLIKNGSYYHSRGMGLNID